MYAEGDFIRINPKSVSYIKEQLLQIIELFVKEDKTKDQKKDSKAASSK